MAYWVLEEAFAFPCGEPCLDDEEAYDVLEDREVLVREDHLNVEEDHLVFRAVAEAFHAVVHHVVVGHVP